MHSPQRMPASPARLYAERWRGSPLMALFVVLVAVSVTACQTRGNDSPLSAKAPPPPVFINQKVPLTCRAAEVRFALGQTVNGPLLEQIRIRTGARMARTALTDGVPGTDQDDGRLTVDIDPKGRIIGARCG